MSDGANLTIRTRATMPMTMLRDSAKHKPVAIAVANVAMMAAWVKVFTFGVPMLHPRDIAKLWLFSAMVDLHGSGSQPGQALTSTARGRSTNFPACLPVAVPRPFLAH